MKIAPCLVLVVIALIVVASAPAFADGPDSQDGKEDAVVSPLLQQFIQEHEDAPSQQIRQPADESLVRGQYGGSGPAATSASARADSAPTNDRVRFDDSGNGNCTLRAAIHEANSGNGGVINFKITGGGTRTIQPSSALPAITRPVFIDGYSQQGASAGTVLIELDGSNAGAFLFYPGRQRPDAER